MSRGRHTTAAYVAPFAAFVGVMAIERALGIPAVYAYPARFVIASLVLLIFSRHLIPQSVAAPLLSIAIGATVFVIWIGPDVLFGPGYRASSLFQNAVMGRAESSIHEGLRQSAWFAVLRVASTMLLVPLVEEIFWRGWLMRWLIRSDFKGVPFGQYAPGAFWITAVLFATEHGPYWEVGLAAGIVYNWLAIRTRSLGACVLAHAVTNGLLAAYVLVTGRWQYWL
jgi:CAAX prenyl protease-like protein